MQIVLSLTIRYACSCGCDCSDLVSDVYRDHLPVTSQPIDWCTQGAFILFLLLTRLRLHLSTAALLNVTFNNSQDRNDQQFILQRTQARVAFVTSILEELAKSIRVVVPAAR